jgi:GT2 family glycosyltransferase
VKVGWTWGTAVAARREAVLDVGPLSEAFFLYGEDLEWCLRMRRAKWEVWFCAGAEVIHRGGESSRSSWSHAERFTRRLDGIYRAVMLHHGPNYVRALQAEALFGHAVEWLLARLRRRPSAGLAASVAYHWRALRAPAPRSDEGRRP